MPPTRPPMPWSISSKIRVGVSSARPSTVFSASIRRDVSPPDATLASGRSGSPGLAETRNATVSSPWRRRRSGPACAPIRIAESVVDHCAGRVRRPPDVDGEASAGHLQVGQLGLDRTSHALARRAACGRQFGALPAQLGQQPGFLCLQFLDALARVGDRFQLGRRPLAVREHLFDRVAVLALQAVDQVQALLDLLQPPRVELDAVAVVAQLAADVVQQRGRLAQLLEQSRPRSGRCARAAVSACSAEPSASSAPAAVSSSPPEISRLRLGAQLRTVAPHWPAACAPRPVPLPRPP